MDGTRFSDGLAASRECLTKLQAAQRARVGPSIQCAAAGAGSKERKKFVVNIQVRTMRRTQACVAKC